MKRICYYIYIQNKLGFRNRKGKVWIPHAFNCLTRNAANSNLFRCSNPLICLGNASEFKVVMCCLCVWLMATNLSAILLASLQQCFTVTFFSSTNSLILFTVCRSLHGVSTSSFTDHTRSLESASKIISFIPIATAFCNPISIAWPSAQLLVPGPKYTEYARMSFSTLSRIVPPAPHNYHHY